MADPLLAASHWHTTIKVSCDDAKTPLQKRDFANAHCLSGTFAWALDLGGPGTKSDLAYMNPNAGMAGARTDGSDSGLGNVYIGQEIYTDTNQTIACVTPCNFIFPPLTLPSPTTINFPSYVTALEVAWPTLTVVTGSNGAVTTTTTYARTIQTTTRSIPAMVATAIDAWSWNITGNVTDKTYTLSSSVPPPPFYITNCLSSTPPGITAVTRTITPPPFPWATTTTGKNPFPTITFEVEPPAPFCTVNCGHQCQLFCAGQCEMDCSDGGLDFYDLQDPYPPSTPGCRGPDCHNGKCTGPKCIYVVCDDDDCHDGIYTGDHCHTAACSGTDCGSDDRCNGHPARRPDVRASIVTALAYVSGRTAFPSGVWASAVVLTIFARCPAAAR